MTSFDRILCGILILGFGFALGAGLTHFGTSDVETDVVTCLAPYEIDVETGFVTYLDPNDPMILISKEVPISEVDKYDQVEITPAKREWDHPKYEDFEHLCRCGKLLKVQNGWEVDSGYYFQCAGCNRIYAWGWTDPLGDVSYDPNDSAYKFIPEAPKEWTDKFGVSERTRLLHSISELRVVVARMAKQLIALEKPDANDITE